MIEIAFIGTCVDMDELKNFPAASVAGNKYQLGLIDLFDNQDFHITQLLMPVYASFPRGKKIFVTNKDLEKKYKDRKVCPYINIPFIKQFTVSFSLFFKLLSWNRQNRKKDRCVIIYNLFSYRDFALRLFCKLKRVPRILAIADVTEKGYGFWKDLECDAEKKLIQKYDGLIPIADRIQTDYAPKLTFYRIEGGIFEPVSPKIEKKTENNGKTIVYTGALNQYSNIEMLIEAFGKIENADARLVIAGDGYLAEMVKNSADKDSRISFLGSISYEEAIRLQNEADILVCPRQPDDFVTKYTFPSKLMEYFSTGNTVVSFRLQGIPPEYEPYIHFPKDVTADALAETLSKCKINDTNKRNDQIDFINGKLWKNFSKDACEFVQNVTGNYFNN